MKREMLTVLAGVGAPLILTAGASAGFLGIKAVGKPNEFGLIVCSVYAVFDRPGEDLMQAVAGTANAPMVIQVEGGGTFYNHALGSVTNASPPTVLINAGFPSLAFDSFATVGARVDSNAFPDATTLAPGLPLIAESVFQTTASGWGVTPIDRQGDPFNTDYSSGNGQILIGQFATADGTGFSGTMLLRVVANGKVGRTYLSFYHVVPAPGVVGLLGVAPCSVPVAADAADELRLSGRTRVTQDVGHELSRCRRTVAGHPPARLVEQGLADVLA